MCISTHRRPGRRGGANLPSTPHLARERPGSHHISLGGRRTCRQHCHLASCNQQKEDDRVRSEGEGRPPPAKTPLPTIAGRDGLGDGQHCRAALTYLCWIDGGLSLLLSLVLLLLLLFVSLLIFFCFFFFLLLLITSLLLLLTLLLLLLILLTPG